MKVNELLVENSTRDLIKDPFFKLVKKHFTPDFKIDLGRDGIKYLIGKREIPKTPGRYNGRDIEKVKYIVYPNGYIRMESRDRRQLILKPLSSDEPTAVKMAFEWLAKKEGLATKAKDLKISATDKAAWLKQDKFATIVEHIVKANDIDFLIECLQKRHTFLNSISMKTFLSLAKWAKKHAADIPKEQFEKKSVGLNASVFADIVMQDEDYPRLNEFIVANLFSGLFAVGEYSKVTAKNLMLLFSGLDIDPKKFSSISSLSKDEVIKSVLTKYKEMSLGWNKEYVKATTQNAVATLKKMGHDYPELDVIAKHAAVTPEVD